MTDVKQTSAPAISRALRAAGFGVVVTRLREGLLVTRNFGSVCVTAQFDGPREALRRATEAAYALRELGYEVKQNETILDVTKGELP